MTIHPDKQCFRSFPLSCMSQELSREGKDQVQGREVTSSALIVHATH